jgi:rRNA maturation endonuclease Nob1
LDGLFGIPTAPTKSSQKPKYEEDVSWEEECYGCGEHFEDCSCSDCGDEDCEDW